MIATLTNTVEYFYVFHGSFPEILQPPCAYRRAGRSELHERKVIKCPYCKEPLTDVSRTATVKLYRNPDRKQIKCFAYPVCHICGNEVGMIVA